jgi:membrane protein YqaA with SNARE-associated domain
VVGQAVSPAGWPSRGRATKTTWVACDHRKRPLLRTIVRPVVIFLATLGGFGIFLLGIVDASLLFLPLALDILVVVLSARNHDLWPYYAGMAALGSVVGCFTTDWVGRKGGEQGLEKRLSKRRLKFFQKRVQASSGVALAVASVAPPGFPLFSPVVLVAAALKYPRVKLLSIVGVFRFIRFSAEGLLAVRFGRRILRLANSPTAQHAVTAVIVISLIGSAWFIFSWTRSSRQ